MPYGPSQKLPGEHASKFGHLEILDSPLVQHLMLLFKPPDVPTIMKQAAWQPLPSLGESLERIFCVDGSLQVLDDRRLTHRALAFVKTALVEIDAALLRGSDSHLHPFALYDQIAEATTIHATALPLRHVCLSGLSLYDTLRQVIFDSLCDSALNGEVMITLKWLIYEQWTDAHLDSPELPCPQCRATVRLPFDAEIGACSVCGATLFISDLLGFHLEMIDEAAPESLVSAYMLVHETLLLFTAVRQMWGTDRAEFHRCLFIKDGPLQLRAQYARLVGPIRRFLQHAYDERVPIYLMGQEKTGQFVEHLDWIGNEVPPDHLFLPDHRYICEQIQHRPAVGAVYGKHHNYGAKTLVTLRDRTRLVLMLPVEGDMESFMQSPDLARVMSVERLFGTLPLLLSPRHANALIPIEVANSLASLAAYPSTTLLRAFAGVGWTS